MLGTLRGMPPIPCRQCSAPVSFDDATCVQCGAIQPARREIEARGYEWKSRGRWMGSPLVHVAFGHDAAGRMRTACGVIAVGQRAVGGIAVGIVATGFMSFGVVSCGVFSLGVVSVAALLAAGVNALGPMAFGVVAIGYKVGGVATFGWKTLFSVAG
jgi:hypothetical protein